MTKDELIGEIQQYVVPIQANVLKTYSQERLEDYLNHLRALGRRRETQEPVAAVAGHSHSHSN